jgi:hypothetical protein
MLRWFVRTTAVLVIVFSLLMAASTLLGRSADPPIVIVTSSSQRFAAVLRLSDQIAFIDLTRMLRIDRSIPLDNLQKIFENYPPDGSMTVATYKLDTPNKYYESGLYRYNYVTGAITDVVTIRQEDVFSLPDRGYLTDFFSVTDRSNDQILYLHPLDQKLRVFDIKTHETTVLDDINLQLEDGWTPIMAWSPDGSKIALKLARTLYIFNRDGSEQRQYDIESLETYPIWSQDGKYLLFQRYYSSSSQANQPIEVMDVSDGSEPSFTRDLTGRNVQFWGCDGRWLTYVRQIENVPEGYSLDMETGETIRVNDDPLLADVPVRYVSTVGCNHFLVMAEPPTIYENPTTMYLFNVATKSAEYLGEISSVISQPDTSAFYYQTYDDARGSIQIFRRSLDPSASGSPELVREIAAPEPAYMNWFADLSFAVFFPSNQSRAVTLEAMNAATGQTYPIGSWDENMTGFYQANWHELKGED